VPIGIVTDRDIIVKVIAEGIELDSIMTGDIMSLEIYTVSENSSIWDTFELMRAKGIRRVPVVNDQNELQGILTIDDVLEIIADEVSAVAKTIRQEQWQEIKRTGSV
jgi:CBS domain-containing protein